MPHLTCVGQTRAEIKGLLDHYASNGIENILALGGDPPKELGLPPGELTHATELVALVTGIGDFSVGVAAHPELHPRSQDRVSDRRHLAASPAFRRGRAPVRRARCARAG